MVKFQSATLQLIFGPERCCLKGPNKFSILFTFFFVFDFFRLDCFPIGRFISKLNVIFPPIYMLCFFLKNHCVLSNKSSFTKAEKRLKIVSQSHWFIYTKENYFNTNSLFLPCKKIHRDRQMNKIYQFKSKTDPYIFNFQNVHFPHKMLFSWTKYFTQTPKIKLTVEKYLALDVSVHISFPTAQNVSRCKCSGKWFGLYFLFSKKKRHMTE